jgi:hypothetical protein
VNHVSSSDGRSGDDDAFSKSRNARVPDSSSKKLRGRCMKIIISSSSCRRPWGGPISIGTTASMRLRMDPQRSLGRANGGGMLGAAHEKIRSAA